MARLFTPQFKQRGRVGAAVVTIAAGAAPFVAGLLALQLLPAEQIWLPAAVAGVSFALGAGLPWAAQNLMGLAGNQGLRRRLQQLLEAENPGLDLSRALFVGFSPGETLHVWHGETCRDVGFLEILPGGLRYYGDEFHWSLPRGFIDHLDLAPPESGMTRLLVRWHVPRESGRTFSLEGREALTVGQARLVTSLLYQRLRGWLRETEAPAPAASFPLDAGVPPTDLSGAQMVDRPAGGSCLTVLAMSAITLLTLWRIAGTLFAVGLVYEAVLWAGMISVLGALLTGYLLHYLQTWEAEHRGRQER